MGQSGLGAEIIDRSMYNIRTMIETEVRGLTEGDAEAYWNKIAGQYFDEEHMVLRLAGHELL